MERVQDAVGDGAGGGAVGVFGDDDCEFVAPEPGDQVLGADAASEAGRQLHQQGVAAFMAEGVVDIFEVVDIDEQHAFLPRAAFTARSERPRQPFGQRGPVREPGERVVGGAEGKCFVAFVQRVGHAVKRLGQFAEFVAARDREAVLVVPGLHLQDALVHRGDRAQQVGIHPPPEVHRSRQRQREQAAQRRDENVFEVGAVG